MNAANSQVILYNKMEKKYNVERCNTQPKCNNNHGRWDELRAVTNTKRTKTKRYNSVYHDAKEKGGKSYTFSGYHHEANKPSATKNSVIRLDRCKQ